MDWREMGRSPAPNKVAQPLESAVQMSGLDHGDVDRVPTEVHVVLATPCAACGRLP